MRSAQVSELKERLDEVLEAVKNGETVEIQDGENTVAEFVPPVRKRSLAEMSPDQKALGQTWTNLSVKARRDVERALFRMTFSHGHCLRLRPSVLEQLLEDRRTGR